MLRSRVLRWPIERLLTKHAQRVLDLAAEEASREHAERVAPQHILLGLVKNRSGVGVHCLVELGIDLDALGSELADVRHVDRPAMNARPAFDDRTEAVLQQARLQAHALRHRYIGTEHLMLGLVEGDQGRASDVLTRLGVTYSSLRDQVVNTLRNPPPPGWARP
ncbi:ATP-dependent Clp protease ATP-binding subunit [Streptosporangium pseudovulgare]|uniref:ATP-dependent Clp protease ATP-binding subunit n=1 Tax=Streptosporangium pseudovulgare TaxID=35765 RepID=UPI00166F716B|nr:ATP-dependent Clp protease ATP-binding subunit [Streptosporangium pseudovulgare]